MLFLKWHWQWTSGNKVLNFWGTWCISNSDKLVSVGRTHFTAQTVSLALLTSSTSLLPDSKHFFLIQRKRFKLPVLASIFTDNFLAYYLELYNIVTFLFFNFKTQLVIIRVFRFINCFLFLYSQWIDKISSNVNQRTYLLFL